ncbi:hypothetical protein GCM10011419_27910 [Vogesella fluminis]|uniref:Solute-binding protein family 3/N-terminal domain-containing protein n=3 Tax=Vogesella fluminis TaxID=1069161 RepID=A0ABQ3HE79_9NEIS|nr:hypothetical protein GCM10011419_27910 [Vogesella fluminis]
MLLGMLAGLSPLAHAACARLVTSGNPEYPPFLWQDPKNDSRLIGANAELMQLVAREIGIPIEVRYAGPWGRVQESARNGRIDLIAGAFLTQPRLTYLRYLQPPIRDTQTLIWTRQQHPLQYQRWEDLQGQEGITVVNNSFGQAFDQFAAANLKLQQVGSVKNALQMLGLGRADYLIYEDAPGLAYAASLNIKGLRASTVPVSREKLYLTVALASACNNEQLAERLSRAMKKLSDERVMDALVEKYLRIWQAQNSSEQRPG